MDGYSQHDADAMHTYDQAHQRAYDAAVQTGYAIEVCERIAMDAARASIGLPRPDTYY